MSDDSTDYRCPFTLDWVRQSSDAESGKQLTFFDQLHVPRDDTGLATPTVVTISSPALVASDMGLPRGPDE